MTLSPTLILKKNLEIAVLEAGFATWLNLGNSAPCDWGGSDPDERGAMELAINLNRGGNLGGIAGESSVWAKGLRICDEGWSEAALFSYSEELCQLAFRGNARGGRILSGLMYLLTNEVCPAPGDDDESCRLWVADFLWKGGELPLGAKVLFSGVMGHPSSYALCFDWLARKGFWEEAGEAARIGAALGEPISIGNNAALDMLKNGVVDFHAIQKGAERGGWFPLAAGSVCLSAGEGVGLDFGLAEIYQSIAAWAGFDSDAWGGLGGQAMRAKRGRVSQCFELSKDWAGKHQRNDIFKVAAELWKQGCLRARKSSPQ